MTALRKINLPYCKQQEIGRSNNVDDSDINSLDHNTK